MSTSLLEFRPGPRLCVVARAASLTPAAILSSGRTAAARGASPRARGPLTWQHDPLGDRAGYELRPRRALTTAPSASECPGRRSRQEGQQLHQARLARALGLGRGRAQEPRRRAQRGHPSSLRRQGQNDLYHRRYGSHSCAWLTRPGEPVSGRAVSELVLSLYIQVDNLWSVVPSRDSAETPASSCRRSVSPSSPTCRPRRCCGRPRRPRAGSSSTTCTRA